MIGTVAAIGIGGGLGALSRFGMHNLATHFWGMSFPWGTLIINILGSFLMGVAVAKFVQTDMAPEWRSFITTGFLGAFTTFSAFSLDFVTLWERGEMISALAYTLVSVIGSILALFLALWLMRGLLA